jgi:hypothetical protein
MYEGATSMATKLRVRGVTLAVLLFAVIWSGANAANHAAQAERNTHRTIGEEAKAAQQSPQRRGRRFEPRGLYKARIEPHWFADNTRFWYRNRLRDGKKEFVLVDAGTATRQKAFDHEKLAAALSKAAEESFEPDKLPFDRIEFVNDGKAIRFNADGSQWEWELDSSETKKVGDAPDDEEDDDADDDRFRRGRRRFGRGGGSGRRAGGGPSPDGEWNAFVRSHNIYLRPAGDDESENPKRLEFQLTTDGVEKGRYGMLQWSPDSTHLVAFQIELPHRARRRKGSLPHRKLAPWRRTRQSALAIL